MEWWGHHAHLQLSLTLLLKVLNYSIYQKQRKGRPIAGVDLKLSSSTLLDLSERPKGQAVDHKKQDEGALDRLSEVPFTWQHNKITIKDVSPKLLKESFTLLFNILELPAAEPKNPEGSNADRRGRSHKSHKAVGLMSSHQLWNCDRKGCFLTVMVTRLCTPSVRLSLLVETTLLLGRNVFLCS